MRMAGLVPRALNPCQHSPGIFSRAMLSSPIMNSLIVPFVGEFGLSSYTTIFAMPTIVHMLSICLVLEWRCHALTTPGYVVEKYAMVNSSNMFQSFLSISQRKPLSSACLSSFRISMP